MQTHSRRIFASRRHTVKPYSSRNPNDIVLFIIIIIIIIVNQFVILDRGIVLGTEQRTKEQCLVTSE